MATPFIKVIHSPSGGVSEDITEFTNLKDKRGLQIKNAKADISILNSRWRYKTGGASSFVEDGTIDIYASYSPIDTTDATHRIMSGQIQGITHNFDSTGSSTKISVSDKTTLLLSSVWSKAYEAGTYPSKVDDIIRSVIQHAPSANGLVTTNNVVATTTAGSAFPEVNIGKVMKPIYEWLTDLSQPGMTGEDKAYLFYVDKDNDLHWFYPSASISGSIVEGVDEIYAFTLQKSNDELVNMLIYNGGQDFYGNGVLWYSYDATSKSNKLRMKFQPMLDVGRDLILEEITAGNIVQSSTGGFFYQGQKYARNGTVTPSWGGSTVSADDDYNDALRTQIKAVCYDKAGSYMKAFSGLRWKGRLEVKGSTGYVAGDFLTIHIPTVGLLSQSLRVWDVQHSFGSDGWVTTLELREDDEAIA